MMHMDIQQAKMNVWRDILRDTTNSGDMRRTLRCFCLKLDCLWTVFCFRYSLAKSRQMVNAVSSGDELYNPRYQRNIYERVGRVLFSSDGGLKRKIRTYN